MLQAVAESASAIATTNGIAAQVTNQNGMMWQGERRGICGDGIRSESLRLKFSSCRNIIQRHNLPIELVGIGGIKITNTCNNTWPQELPQSNLQPKP
ncbi:MAG: hypothetical protein R3C28_30920 [Pirellulaceae bacterium]